MLDPAQLRLLQVVARTGSYSAAARELGYTQPAITYQMRNLERSVGSTIAVRKGRTMQFTAAGVVLLEHADRILAAIRGAESDLAALAGAPIGRIRLAAFPSSCASLVPMAMVSMAAQSSGDRHRPGAGRSATGPPARAARRRRPRSRLPFRAR